MRHVALLGLLLLTACPGSTVKAQVAALESGLTAAEKIADAYVKLPRCGSAGATSICSDPIKVSQIGQADNTAFAAVDAARISAEAGGTPDLTAATAAMAALNALVVTLPKQGS
jgi:pyrimidine deaminase RibD-like protein